MGKGSAPTPPDYVGAAQATANSSAQVNNQQTFANRPNQTSPWGNVTWTNSATTDPATGQAVTAWNQNTSLNPQLQSALDDQLSIQKGRSDIANTMLDRAQSEFAPAVDWSAFPQGGQGVSATNTTAPGQVMSADQERAKAEQAAYASQKTALDQRFGQSDTDLSTQLANKGITEGSDAYTRAMTNQSNAKNSAYSQAMLQAINAGGTEAQRNFSMDLQGQGQNFQQNLAANAQNFGQDVQSSAYQNTLRQQAIAEQLQQRGFSLNEINALLSGQQVSTPSMPSFSGAGKASGADLSGAAAAQGSADLSAYGISQAQSQQTTSTAAGLASLAAYAYMAYSDRRLKRDISRIGRDARGFGIYLYRYVWGGGWHVGVMAQEVRKRLPTAVIERRGALLVNYAAL